MQVLEPLLSQNGICSAFTTKIPKAQLNDILNLNSKVRNIYLPMTNVNVNTIVVYGETLSMMLLSNFLLQATHNNSDIFFQRVWVMTAQIDFAMTIIQMGSDLQVFQGAISFTVHSHQLPKFQKFLLALDPCQAEGNNFLNDFLEQALNCLFQCPKKMEVTEVCSWEESLKKLPRSLFEMDMTGHSYSIYNAVYAVAYALHSMELFRSKLTSKSGMKRTKLKSLQPWQVMTVGISFPHKKISTDSYIIHIISLRSD